MDGLGRGCDGGPATPDAVRAALHAVLVWPPDLAPDDPFRPLADLDVASTTAAIAARLGGAPVRVGWSALVMGVASRLWAVTVVPAVTHRVLPDPRCLLVRDDAGAVVLGVAEPRGWRDPGPDDVRRAALDVLTPLVEALPLSRRLLWGNVAASLHAVPRVHALPAAVPLVDRLLARAPLAGELETGPGGEARRLTCCLFWQVPGAGLCGDCVLTRVPVASGRRGP